MLSDPVSRTKTIPGNRSFHQLNATFKGGIGTKRVSEDINHSVKFDFEQVQQVLNLLMVSIVWFVLCTCDSHEWVDMACEVNTAHKDTEIKFTKT